MQVISKGHMLGQMTAEETSGLLEGLQRMGYYNPDFADLKRGLNGVSLVRVKKGAVLMSQNATPDGAYIVRRGRLSVTRRLPDGKVVQLAEVGDFSVLGEMALVEGRPRSATVTASEDSELYSFSPSDFRFLMDSCEVFRQIISTLIQDRNRYNAQRIGD